MSKDTSSGSAIGRWRIVGMLVVFAGLGHFNRIAISVAGSEVFIPVTGLSETQMGWVYTTFLIVYTIGMMPGGWLIDRIGSARTLALYGISMGLFVMSTGIVGLLLKSPQSLWIGLLFIRGLAGVCNAPLHPGAAHVVSDLVTDRKRATANGLVTAGALVGIAFSYPIFGGLMDRLSWPLAFVVCGLVLSGYGMLWHWTTREFASSHRATSPASSTKAEAIGGWRLLGQANLWLLALSYAAYGYFQYLFFYWVGYYFETVLKAPKVDARWASFWIMLAMGAGMAIGGMTTDFVCQRFGKMRGRRIIVMTGLGMGGLFGLLGVNATHQINVAMCLAVSMAALGICEGVFWTTATDIGGTSRGFSGAFMNTLGNVGGFISPVLTPILAEKIGWSKAIMVACLIASLGGPIWFAIRLPEPDAAESSGNRLETAGGLG